MKNQVAEKMYQRFLESEFDFETIKHIGKKKAIKEGFLNYKKWFEELQNITPESLCKALGWDKWKADPRKKSQE